jgi:glycosyltransferase involved in cell wall biosynthesis
VHAVQINFLPAPQGCAPEDVFQRWPSLSDIPEAVASSGTQVSVIQAAAYEASVSRNGVDYHFTDIRGMDSLSRQGQRFADQLVRIKADVLHVHGLGFGENAFAISQRLPRLPVLFQDHADRPPRWWRRRAWRQWYGTAAGVAFTAPELAQPFTSAGLFGPATRLFAIPESSSRFACANRAEARASTGLHGDPCVLWVGHLNPGKDPLTVLDGVAQAAQQLPGLQLWCAFGSDALLPEVTQRIDGDPVLAGRVHLLGKVAHERIERLMQASELFVSGSHAESCGYALLEAMACGVAPVVTDIPSFRALTGGGRIGNLWPCGDAAKLAEALVRTAVNRPLPTRVRAHFDAHLSFTAVGRQWADAYAQMLDGAQRRSA